MTHFTYPWFFVLLGLPFLWRFLLPPVKGLHGDALKIPFIGDLEKISIKSGNVWKIGSGGDNNRYSKNFWLLFAIWFLLITALARPQWLGEPVRVKEESRDIMLVLDISTSMLANDFVLGNRRIDRLTAVKNAAADFVRKRANDRVGLVLFGTRAYLQSPLTYDKQSLTEILWLMDAGMAGDSTSIGDALGLALKNMANKNKISKNGQAIVLLTDGESNDGSLSMAQAIKLAEAEGIKTYTIGVGNKNMFLGLFSALNPQVDEKGLKALAAVTKGQYFRAESATDLQKIYDLIDQLEGNSAQGRFIREVKELYYIPLMAAILMSMALALVLRRAY